MPLEEQGQCTNLLCTINVYSCAFRKTPYRCKPLSHPGMWNISLCILGKLFVILARKPNEIKNLTV